MLNMDDCNLSRNKTEKLCEQFSQLSNLGSCYLSGNSVGEAVSVLAESIQSWGVNNSLRTLSLAHCKITSSDCSRLLEALEVCQKLLDLTISYNTIGGTFCSLISKPVYPLLKLLCLDNTSLTSRDIQTIDCLIKENKIPQLVYLHLSYVNLDNLEMDTLETLESLSSIIHNVPHVCFYKEDYRQDLEKIQERVTRGLLKHKSQNIE